MAKEAPDFPKTLTPDQARAKCGINLLVELSPVSPYPVILEAQSGVGAPASLILVFPAHGGAGQDYCALWTNRQTLLKFAQDIQSHFEPTVEDRILATLERMERVLEQRKNS